MARKPTDDEVDQPKRPRRQYGTGSITRRADGRWMGRIDAGTTAKGKRRQLTVYGATEAEAKGKLEKKRAQIAREGRSVATRSRATVKAWSATWLEQRVTTQTPNAYASDLSAVRNWIVPVLGRKKLEHLTPDDVRAVPRAMREAGRKPSSMIRVHWALVAMLKAAMLEGHDVPHRVLLVKAPNAGQSDRDALSVPEALAVLGEAARLPHGSRWATALLQGMRPAECLGLTWAAVDFDRDIITVSWQLQTLRYNTPRDRTSGFRVPDGYEARHLVDAFHLVRPKSRSGWRVIPMVPWVRAALLAWRDVAPANPHDLVWPATNGRPPRTADDDDEWKALQGAAAVVPLDDHQVELRPVPVGHPTGRYYVRQETRHTTATLLLEAKIDPKVITAILGHSSIATSRGYQHVATEQAADALAQIATTLQLTQAD